LYTLPNRVPLPLQSDSSDSDDDSSVPLASVSHSLLSTLADHAIIGWQQDSEEEQSEGF